MKFYASDQFRVLFEDNHILVVEKPAGILTQPDPDQKQNDLETLAKTYLQTRDKKPAVFLHVVHRLDKEVSGIVLFAKTSKALSRLNEEMRAHTVVRHYLAVVEGKLPYPAGILKHFLIHGSHRALIGKEGDAEAKEAILHYDLIRTVEFCLKKEKVVGLRKEMGFSDEGISSLVMVTLETGRYHQIRAQFSAFGHPVIGDEKYGSSLREKERIFLHHYHLRFIHPVRKTPLNVFLIPQSWIL